MSIVTSQKILVLRLSSLGDVILALSGLSPKTPVDFVVAEEFAPLLRGHPAIEHVFSFDRSRGLRGWVELCRKLSQNNYDEIVDLHVNLRTLIFKVLLTYWGFKLLVWKKSPKYYFRYLGFYLFKNFWPQFLRPMGVRKKFACVLGGDGSELPDLRYLLTSESKVLDGFPEKYYCLMPSSKWRQKCWPLHYFLELAQKLEFPVVILGTNQDTASLQLVEMLRHSKISFISAVGKLNLIELAKLLAGSQGYIGNDTGLSHLAEAVGTPAYVIFGPTVPEMGFGPSLPESKALGTPLWCRPCGKTGRFCHRIFKRYECLNKMTPEMALRQIRGDRISESQTWRFLIYRFFHQQMTAPLSTLFLRKNGTPKFPLLPKSENRIWFHASSQGELESLWSLIGSSLEAGIEVIVSVFSPSAFENLKKLKHPKLLYVGPSPLEGYWGEALLTMKPTAFVTTKYEAWPELWASLAFFKIPLLLINARARSSLLWAKWICYFLGVRLPKILFLTPQEECNAALEKAFPHSHIFPTGDPRWDRIYKRSQDENSRVKEILDFFSQAPKPWGILAQVWPEDLPTLIEGIKNFEGTLWVVPHERSGKVEGRLKRLGFLYFKTSEKKIFQPSPQSLIVVDEMGVLAELYSAMDWAYVGGGFSKGVHSTMEPALYGLPIAAGPKKIHEFPETRELLMTQQLKLIRNRQQWQTWLKDLRVLSPQQKNAWREKVKTNLGATPKILSFLQLKTHGSLESYAEKN